MENKKQVSPMEGLDIAMKQLNSINVPVGLTEQISIPLARAVNLIGQCVPFLTVKPMEEEKEPEPEDDEAIDLGEIDLSDVEEEK